jgi:hypothetical protein
MNSEYINLCVLLTEPWYLHWRFGVADDDAVTCSVSVTIYRGFLQKHGAIHWRCGVTG